MGDPIFMHGLDDPTIKWRFDIIGGGAVTGYVVNYVLQSNGTPITIVVQRAQGGVLEIPWTSIATISCEGE